MAGKQQASAIEEEQHSFGGSEMADMKIGIAAKLSKIEWDMHRLNLGWDEVISLYNSQEKDADKILASHYRQKRSIDELLSRCPGAEVIDLSAASSEAAKPGIDLLIAIGGDNFFQLCSHRFPDAYLVGVNADPETSHGAILNYTHDTLLPVLDNILAGKFRTESWTRIATELNGRRVEDATCTISLSIKATDMISRYLLKTADTEEEQKSTGLLVVTGAGSGTGAWYRNAGLYLSMLNSGRNLSKTEEFGKDSGLIKTLTREPFLGEDCPYQLLNHTINLGESISLIYWANDPSELSIDSIRRYEVKDGDTLKFYASEKPLKVVGKD
jgi:NAD kinase